MRRKRKATEDVSEIVDRDVNSHANNVKSKCKTPVKTLETAKTTKIIVGNDDNDKTLHKNQRKTKKNVSESPKTRKSNTPRRDATIIQNKKEQVKETKKKKASDSNSNTKKKKALEAKASLLEKPNNHKKTKQKLKITEEDGRDGLDQVDIPQEKQEQVERDENNSIDDFNLPKNKRKNVKNKKCPISNSKNNVKMKTLVSSNSQNNDEISKEREDKESESSESEWEEVEEAENEMDLDDYKPDIPKEGVEITLNVSDSWKYRKRKKKEIEFIDVIRRGVNRFRKNIQIELHKVHLLCLLAHGFYINRLLLNKNMLALIFSHIPIDFNVNSKADKSDISKTVEWYKEYFDYDFSFETSAKNIRVSIENAIEKSKITSRRDYNMIFLLLIRSLGLEGRLCLSLYPLPIKSDNLLQNKNKLNTKNSECKESNNENENKPKSCRNRNKKLAENKNVSVKSDIKTEKSPKNTRNKTKSQKSRQVPKESDSDSDFESTNTQRTYTLRKNKKISMKETDSDGDLDNNGSESSSDDFSIEEKRSRTSTKVRKSCDRSETNESSSSKKSSKTKMPHTKTIDSDDDIKVISKYNGIEYWLEIYSKSEDRWICVDCVNNIIDKPYKLEARARQPITYVLAFDDKNYVKDVTKRYASNWMTNVRKLRIDSDWWNKTLLPFMLRNSEQDENENKQLDQVMLDQPFPKTIDKFKDHPLYVLKRHLLKFQAIYPPDSPSLGFVRGEPIYARECVHTLHSRETWLKQARVVRIGEVPYKIVKARPKWNKMKGELDHDLPLEIFGIWQTEKYVSPPAENGKVPRNEYGNVDLYQPSMLPAGTVHIQLPGLIRIARKLNIDCAAAMVGFDGNWGHSHPVFDGVVVCEEFRDVLIAAWEEDQEIQQQREKEKREKRIYDNWKRLIKKLLAKEKIKNKYCLN
ncbi:DNA repair protein complementing XP-C cells homolog isoform X1 [Centruroides sculpturatus]|uniref:DNA repair protein complementing XP-C cells homolog isoform X1 n=1 Tax=Centruroides sculpturatus TaxID=218467 RepID=UPI000C6E0D66|nr:DNA repair protein complementing XP-C cells homolog isoform X1 [Centruroides sculpturatus]XP_023241607.1 DNA repair protein complementing XP-C cells homolog isoform X2 [Centruroides sculpturatus]XP_023241613.1 DNA repair protein complementing XP-C cells homolog isoform X1 [Centruroides sculpturatus]